MRRSRGRKSESASGCIPEPLIIFALLVFSPSLFLSLDARVQVISCLSTDNTNSHFLFNSFFRRWFVRASFHVFIDRIDSNGQRSTPKATKRRKLKAKFSENCLTLFPRRLGEPKQVQENFFLIWQSEIIVVVIVIVVFVLCASYWFNIAIFASIKSYERGNQSHIHHTQLIILSSQFHRQKCKCYLSLPRITSHLIISIFTCFTMFSHFLYVKLW